MIIISISKVFQVQNKPMGFLPPIQMKGLITMKLIHAKYNPMHNSIDITTITATSSGLTVIMLNP